MMRTYMKNINADFTCKHCGRFVSALSAVSGVLNRNHCPHCLCSRHVDLFKAGDRLCACKSLMVPVGLTLKKCKDKYAHELQGELMLIHRCTACGALSINRIAADDDPVELMAVFTRSQTPDAGLKRLCEAASIHHLKQADYDLVKSRLYGIAVQVA
jgi:hypothetical protein